eukprot:365655-Chlamydomonas_euryale.AAC.5
MDTLMKELSVPLTRYLAAFPAFERLHPFEQALLELTVGRDKYINVLSKVWQGMCVGGGGRRCRQQLFGACMSGLVTKMRSKLGGGGRGW